MSVFVWRTHKGPLWATRAGHNGLWPHTECWGPPHTARSSRSSEPSPCGGWRSGSSSLCAGSRRSCPSYCCFSHWPDQTESPEELWAVRRKGEREWATKHTSWFYTGDDFFLLLRKSTISTTVRHIKTTLRREMMMDMHGKMSVGKQVEVCYVSNTSA